MNSQALTLILFFAIPFSLFAIIRPKQAILAILVLALFTGPAKMLLGIRETPLILDIALIVAILSIFIENHLLKNEKLALPRYSFAVLVLLLASFFQMFNSSIESIQAALEGFRLSAFYMIAFFSARYVLTSTKDILLLMKTLIVASFFIGIYGIRQHYFPFDGEIYWAMSSAQQMQLFWGKEMRVFSTLNGLGAFAMFIPLSIVTHVAFYNLTESRKWKRFTIISLLFFSIAALFSMTRSAWLASLIGVFFFTFALEFKEKRRLFIFLGAFLIIGIIILNILPKTQVLVDRMGTLEALESDSGVMTRFLIMEDAIEWLYEHPLGNGIGSTSSAIYNLYSTETIAGHNQYLDMALELGIIPSLFYLFIVFASLLYGWRLTFRSKEPTVKIAAAWITAYNLAFQAISAQGQVFGFPQSLHFWFLMGLLVSLEHLSKDLKKADEETLRAASTSEERVTS